MKAHETDHLHIVEKTDGVFTHEEIIYLGENIIEYELVGLIKEGNELVKVYKRI